MLLNLVFVQGWGKEMVPASSLVLRDGVHDCCYVGSLARRANNLPPVSQASLSSLSSSCLFLGNLPTWQCSAPWALSQGSQLNFKSPKFKGLAWQGPALQLWVGSRHAGTDADLTQKGSQTKVQRSGIWSKAQQPVSRLATLSRCLCSYAEGQGREMVLAGSFVP